MHRFLNTTQHSVVWFKKGFESGELEIAPPFQRNPVWSDRQKAALIDTILLEYPIPELYMQELTDASGIQKQIVVDGQQRIRAVMSFLSGEFELSDESPRAPGLSFDDLSADDRKRIFEYSFVIRLLPDMPDTELRDIFQRINRNTVTLNQQELRHATYWGPFIRLMEELSDLEFWSAARLFSANDRRRMLDVEYVSELAVAVLNGLQNKKRNLEEFYQQYETSFDDAERLRSVFVSVLGELDQAFADISTTRWRKKSDFYTLFMKLAKHFSALPLSEERRVAIRERLLAFGREVDALGSGGTPPDPRDLDDVLLYAKHVERAASDLGSRRAREQALDNVLALLFPIDPGTGQ